MFTWEEAGLLRSMLIVLKWGLVALILGIILLEHEPLGAALNSGYRMVERTLQPPPAAGPVDRPTSR